MKKIALFVGAALALGAAAPAGAQDVTLRIHHFLPPSSTAHVQFMKPWADKVMKEAGGKLKVDIFPAMQLGGAPPALYDQARDGVVDIVWTLPSYTAGRFPTAEVFELPFMAALSSEVGSQAVQEFAEKHLYKDDFKDVHPLAVWEHAPGLFHMVSKEVKTIDDLKGLKLRFPTRQFGEALKALGASPVGMPAPAVPEALQKAVIDGCVFPWEVVPSLRIHELTKFHTAVEGERGLYTSVFIFAMNKRKYEGLPPDIKKVIDANSGMALAKELGKVWDEAEKPGLEAAKKVGGTVYALPAAEVQKWKAATQPVIDAWMADMKKRGKDGKALYEEANALYDKYSKK
jgi:TRAP-type C4-dicarboxylate transport system substrate-binding protein